jgi:hypothetical protein
MRRELDDVDELLNLRRRPGDDEAVGRVVRDDPNSRRSDQSKSIGEIMCPRVCKRDHLDDNGLKRLASPGGTCRLCFSNGNGKYSDDHRESNQTHRHLSEDG